MRTTWRTFLSIRWPLLVFVVPPAMLWGLTMPHTGGWLAIVAVACIALLWGALLDAHFLLRGQDPRLALRDDRDRFWLPGVLGLRTLLAVGSIVLSVALLFVSWAMGIAAVIGVGVLLVMAWADAGHTRRRRFWLSELVLPVGLIGVPFAMASLSARSEAARVIEAEAPGAEAEAVEAAVASLDVVPVGVVEGVVLFGVGLGVWALLLLLRDQAKDAGEGYLTTPTLLGRTAGSALLTLGLLACVAVASLGVGGAVWAWATPVVIAGGALGAIWLHATRADGQAAFLWTLGHAVVAVLVLGWAL